jgi:23S rRNA (pseudouridine1915-N3)-methyltransferase
MSAYWTIFALVMIISVTTTHGLVGRLRASSLGLRRATQRHLTTNIVVVGKKNGGEEWISSGYGEYEKRLKPIMNLQTVFLKSDDELVRAAETAKGYVIALDEKGKHHTSQEFTEMLYKAFTDGGSTVTFIIGGFAGLPPEIRSKFPLISLSKMTWTHTMARLLLTEQIYRATEIRKGSSYHKE